MIRSWHTVQGKSWDHFCASAEGAVSDSVFPSMIAHCGAIGMGRRCKSVAITTTQDSYHTITKQTIHPERLSTPHRLTQIPGRAEIKPPIGMNIAPWNRQGPRPKRKEPQNHLLENQIDTPAPNETLPKPKFKFHPPGYDIHKNDRSVGTKGGVAIPAKKGITANQEWKNEHPNAITDNEAPATETEPQNGDKVILATISCPPEASYFSRGL